MENERNDLHSTSKQYSGTIENPYLRMYSEIIPNLYLGDVAAATAPDVHAFHTICNISREVPFSKLLEPNVQTARFDVLDESDDSEQDTMVRLIPAAVDVIDKALKNNRAVLVHCLEGKMRSSTIVTAYLMKALKLDLDAAMKFVRSKHRPAFDFGCYSHFAESLEWWQNQIQKG